jgi:hypothetical protein
MKPFALVLLLAWRHPVRLVALAIVAIGLLLFTLAPAVSAVWILFLIPPAFLISRNLSVPGFSQFELAMPLTRPQLLWARILGALDMVWAPLLVGLGIKWAYQQPLHGIGRTFTTVVFFSGCVCLATLARLTPSPVLERVWALLSLTCAILMLVQLDQPAAAVIAGAAAIPIAAKLRWTYVPEWPILNGRVASDHPIWPLLQVLCSWRTLATVLFAFWVGFNRSWGTLFLTGFFLQVDRLPNSSVLGLPISRRSILAARLLPAILPFFIGVAFDNHWQRSDGIVSLTLPSEWSAPPQLYGLQIPPDFSRESDTPPPIVAPWGEAAQSLPTGNLYNPYWVSPFNSERFAAWQFARATRAVYGKTLRPEELGPALRAGLRPITGQPRFKLLRMGVGAAWFVAVSLFAALGIWRRFNLNSRFIAGALKSSMQPALFILASIIARAWPRGPRLQFWLIRLSAILPANIGLMTLLLLAVIGTLYWGLETIYSQVEFLDKPKETE